jgi:predicted outer membrane repeat protein
VCPIKRAIEEVYWRHRIWPKERSDPKPSIDAGISEMQVERKVEGYLRDSQALEDYWQKPITAEQLQAEMDRMAQHTKQPEVLRELFDALGSDPFVIAECLARPLLTQRLVTDLSNEDRMKLTRVAWLNQPLQPFVGKGAGTQAITIAALNAKYTLPTISGGTNCINDTWRATSTTNAPDGRANHTAVWTGSEMIVWGGNDFNGTPFNTGGRYDPSTDSWTATSTTNAPEARAGYTAVWTGDEMIVWGGIANGALNTGGRYNPTTNSWTATSTTNAPSARQNHTAVWTGREMIVWGGGCISRFCSDFVQNTGGRYNPIKDRWTATSTTNAPAARTDHTAVWTGSEMIVWGGQNENALSLNTGGRYDPSTDSWTATSTTNAPSSRGGHTAVWTGDEMIVWGGFINTQVGSTDSNSGGRYNPMTDSWTATSATNAPAARNGQTALWTGSEMIIWGGGTNRNMPFFKTGGRYCAPAQVNTIAVTNTNDSGPGLLRKALAVANDGDTIDATRVSGTILLTSGTLQIKHNVHIKGPGAANLAVDGNARFSVFENLQSVVTISGFTITNGSTGGGILNKGPGAALTLSRCSVVSNAGVGISNFSGFFFGGIAHLTITNCTVSGNSGGGISNIATVSHIRLSQATVTVSECTISGNRACNGGGIYNSGGSLEIRGRATVTISNSTLSGNSATGDGGAIYNDGLGVSGRNAFVSVTSSTFSGNSATGHGGGIYIDGGDFELGDTILKRGSSGENIFNNGGTVTSRGYNLATDNGGGFLTGPGDQINTLPRLGPLRDNGGPTFTHALLPGSPAINAGNPNFTGASFDQRGPGFPRVVNGRIDIGSFEVQATPTPTPTAP